MTEHDWIASDDPQRMLQWSTVPGADYRQGLRFPLPSDRQLRLFACACCRQVWDQLADPRSKQAVEVAERYADSDATEADLRKHHEGSFYWMSWPYATDHSPCEITAEAAHFFRGTYKQAPSLQAALLRDIVGNPWHLTTLGRMTSCNLCFGHTPDVREGCCHVPFRLTPTVLAIARRAYDEHCPADSLAVLADALEDAGCASEDVLRHLRGQEPDWRWKTDHDNNYSTWVNYGWRSLRGPHARGCWAIDLVLGKG